MTASPEMDVSACQFKILRDVRIPRPDGRTLSADVYQPAVDEQVPVLVMANPYRKDAGVGTECEPYASWFAERGYATVLVDFAGCGSSDGPMRSPFDPHEKDDGIQAIEWAAAQPWSTGRVGMWGLSYGAIMAMRCATEPPPALKAILPVMGTTDPELDFVNPNGNAGGQAPIPWWGTCRLADQLTPPLRNFHSANEQARWLERLDDRPAILDMFERPPGDPRYREARIEARDIKVPAFCVAGWRDMFWDAQVRAYEEMSGPKRLLVGPWMHVVPCSSPVDPVDFLPMAKAWWDYWLRGIGPDPLAGPRAHVYLTGKDKGWRELTEWPTKDGDRVLVATSAGELVSAATEGPMDRSLRIPGDPTVGTLAGLWSLGSSGYGMPADQDDDDKRALIFETSAIAEEVTISGRILVELSTPDGSVPLRLVARVTEVDGDGRSTLLTSGSTHNSTSLSVNPIFHRVAAGNRLRVSLSEADFPRLWPLPRPQDVDVQAVVVRLPTLSEGMHAPTNIPALAAQDPRAATMQVEDRPQWEITRDFVNNRVEVRTGTDVRFWTSGRANLIRRQRTQVAAVDARMPHAAEIKGRDIQETRLETGENVVVSVETRLTAHSVNVNASVSLDGQEIVRKAWNASH